MDFGTLILYLPMLIFSVVFHEVSHGWVADRLGDPTARFMGRLTLNPMPHLDLWGSVLLPGMLFLMHSPFLFGYAKPVPVNVSNLRNPRTDGLKVALVGPASNLVLATLFAFAYTLTERFVGHDNAVFKLAEIGLVLNCVLAIFNLIPIPPLDGSWILDHLLPRSMLGAYYRVKPYGMLLLMLVLLLPGLSQILIRGPVEYVATLLLIVSRVALGMHA